MLRASSTTVYRVTVILAVIMDATSAKTIAVAVVTAVALVSQQQ
jgi:hypothetical protein